VKNVLLIFTSVFLFGCGRLGDLHQMDCRAGLQQLPAGSMIRLTDEEYGNVSHTNPILLIHKGSSIHDGFSSDLDMVSSVLDRYNRDIYPTRRIVPLELENRRHLTIRVRKDWLGSQPFPIEIEAILDKSKLDSFVYGEKIELKLAGEHEVPDISILWCHNPWLKRDNCLGLRTDPDLELPIDQNKGRIVDVRVAKQALDRSINNKQSDEMYYGYSLWLKPTGQATCLLVSDDDASSIAAAANACIRRRVDVDAPLSVLRGTIPSLKDVKHLASKCRPGLQK
jgi:hypothetical protein